MIVLEKKQIHLAFDARMIFSSGIGTYIVNLLQKLNTIPRIHLRVLGDEKKILEKIPNWIGEITPFFAPIYSIAEHFTYPSLRKKEMLHVPHYNASLRYLRRSIVTVHDLIHLQSKQFMLPHYRFYCYSYLLAVTKFSPQILTISQTSYKNLVQYFPKAASKTKVIYNGFSSHLFSKKSSPNKKKLFLRRFRLDEGYLLHVGIGKKHKNVDFLVRSLAMGWKSGSITKPLVLAGCGGIMPSYVGKEVKRLGLSSYVRVIDPLPFDELACLYQCASLFLFPSIQEGFGFPVLEALGCGLPILCSNIAVLKEVAQDVAFYFDPHNEKEFQEKITYLLNNHSLRRRVAGYGKRYVKRYTWEKHTKELLKVYEKTYSSLFL